MRRETKMKLMALIIILIMIFAGFMAIFYSIP